MKLRAALRATLAGWEADVPLAWRKVIGETELNWNSRDLDRDLSRTEIILPARKGVDLAAAPRGAHVFHAFDRTDPAKVRAVILGQDPYPNPAWASGRAFEQGNLTEWPADPQPVARSLRRLVQAIVSLRTGNGSYTAGDRAWSKLTGDARAGVFRLEPPRILFDRLEREGVLFLNTSLTISVVSRPGARKERHRHSSLWAPLIHRVLCSLSGRQTGHVIFLLLGRQAGTVFERSGAEAVAAHAGNWQRRVGVVRHFHPAAITAAGPAFLCPPNPFSVANDLLRRMNARPIRW